MGSVEVKKDRRKGERERREEERARQAVVDGSKPTSPSFSCFLSTPNPGIDR